MALSTVNLRDLHRVHQQLSDLRERAARGPKQVQARQTNVARLTGELDGAKGQIKAARAAADQKQLLLKSAEGKIEDLRRKLNACGSNREYQALLEQIAADEMANSVLADEILEALEKVDELSRTSADAESRLSKAKEELAKTQKTVRDQESLLSGDIKRLELELRESESGLPPDFREAYDRMVKSKGSDAMAQVEGESCGGCCNQITPNTQNALALNRVVFCQNCGRLLYLPEDRSPAGR